MASSTLEKDASVKNGSKRLIFACIAICLQVIAIFLINVYFVEHVELFAIVTRLFGALLVLFIYNEHKLSAIKMTWMILMMALPIFSITFYLLVGLNGHVLKMGRRYREVDERLLPLLVDGDEPLERLDAVDRRAANIARYVHRASSYPLYDDTSITYYDDAADGLAAQIEELRRAERDEEDADFRVYLPKAPVSQDAQGFVLPYADCPMDDVQVGEDVYISVAEYAQDYAWFVTPYLIITDEMNRVFGLAAQRGVDVRIITPGIPDKKLVYSLTRSYYYNLVRNGVRIYEYTPGFVHAKMSVADDALATCGTINLDYRSLYHHFENGCFYCGCDAVADTKADFEWMFEQSNEVTDDYRNPIATARLGNLILRLAAPLM